MNANKVDIIESIKHKAKVLDWIVLLIIFTILFVNVRIMSTILQYIPSLSVSFLLLIVSILVVLGFYISRRIASNSINSLLEYSKMMEHHAYRDTLTNLPSRLMFEKHLSVSFARARRNKDYKFAVLFLDVDFFKNINDSLGHMIGDQLLISIAKTVKSCIRPNDIIARFGGDEFAILLDDIKNVKNTIPIVDRIYGKFQFPFYIDKHEVFTSMSIGIAINDIGYDSPEHIMRDADTAMYRAKSLGRARHVVFDVAMHGKAVARLKLDTDLRRAIERQEFLLHFQPIVSAKEGKLYGFEALVRWNHPERGLIYPMEFIPIAEETGLIIPISRWVLYEACSHMRSWHEPSPTQPPLKININISSKDFLQPNFIGLLKGIILETGIDSRSIGLEITESVIMEHPENIASKLLQLSDLEIQLYIDDFGTGFSSLSYLGHFRVDALKIDKSFVNNMLSDKENLEIVRAIISLASNLEMSVIAEGVETEDQLSVIRKLGCEYAQGYYFSKPLEANAVNSLIQRSLIGQECLVISKIK